jgi:hypothetical protein
MRLSAIAIRTTALVVLLTSFSDYWAYDRWDPAAPMNSCGSSAVSAVFDLDAPPGAALRSTDLPDDHCACCSPTLAPPGPAIPMPAWNSFSAICVPGSVASGLSWPILSSASPPNRDISGFGLPMRI